MYLVSDDNATANELESRERVCKAAVATLNQVGLADFLQHDPKPTFVLDLDVSDIFGKILQPVYTNPALLAGDSGALLSVISGKSNLDRPGAFSLKPYAKYRKWIYEKEMDPPLRGITFNGMFWTKVIIKDRWSVISGVQPEAILEPPTPKLGLSPVPTRNHSPTKSDDSGGGKRASIVKRDGQDVSGQSEGSSPAANYPDESISRLTKWDPQYGEGVDDLAPELDWTHPDEPPDLPSHVQFLRSIDWGSTPIGPMEAWPTELRVMVNLVMRTPEPGVLFWGEEVIMIYNEAYIPLVGDKHPTCMGNSAKTALVEYWEHFTPFITRNKLTGEIVTESDLPIFLLRNGMLEETYYSFTFLPVMDAMGNVVGHYEPVTETTRAVVSERRLATLLRLSEETGRARDLDNYWHSVMQVLGSNEKDVSFALLYSVEEEDETSDVLSTSASSTGFSSRQCVLKGSLGVPTGHPAAPNRLDLIQSPDGFIPYFREAMKSRRPTVLNVEKAALPEEIIRGIEWRGFGDPSKDFVVCPITPTSSTNVQGFLIIGLNPRRPYDDDYQQFIAVSSRLLGTSLASVVLHDDEIRRREMMIAQAESIKAQLAEQLVVSQKEVERTEKRFQRFAERADVGIFIVAQNGYYNYRNKRWHEMFQLPETQLDIRDAWPQLAFPEDLAACEKYFATLMTEKAPVSFELRINRKWSPPENAAEIHHDDGSENHMWILCSAYPELSDTGDVKEIVGCVTDISRQKWAEGLQKKRTEDALESKRQLENFIDTTSHEMRNPLSAIIQCADGIITSNSSIVAEDGRLDPGLSSLLEADIDAAQTIVQCSTHMKCIVDDILTMSKLDSGLLVMTPVAAQPESIGRHAVKMFEAEAKAAGIDLEFEMESTYGELGLDWISLDPTRLLQVLINLITNAIKFTRLETKRQITVSIGASKERPETCSAGNVPYIRTATAAEAPPLVADWAKGENVFILFTVQDSGRGLSNNEKDLLFARFSQASPRTHISYGGSGLGLFISRRLTEMQGGAIGFSSESHKGSTFSFYVKARRTKSPPSAEGQFVPDLMTPVRAASPPPSDQTKFRSPTSPRSASTPSIRPALQPGKVSLPDKLHVLVVEDNLVNQRVLATQLRSKGCHVSVANHGAEAIEHLRRTRYCKSGGLDLSVILMDWEMPVMDGLTCVRAIRQLQKEGTVDGHVPIIAVTANVRNEQITMANEAGMDDVVSKPFRVPELMTRMQALIVKLAAP
ncbi:uncharacterized protein K452DRAFT_226207 [Aplosporella prunicola CBS 121167]|uniref:Histidine kinase n=1 Tax=Aplosporella prunicola CBS 121167 TaxID=1176127 RepID=A0A6A6BI46_9PEZI|nr:uncharacterized protein K452DRAFT_226207 [Aplosporella prunicola CBS 121167]KAF2142924.1 hypothetical protein K452DRAFT_226207 [Aplosporella prunicola CBS 121167]